MAKTRENLKEEVQDRNTGQIGHLQDLKTRNLWIRGKRGTKRLQYLGDDSKSNPFTDEDEVDGNTETQEDELKPPKQEKRRRSRSPDLGRAPKPQKSPKQDKKSPGGELGNTTPPPEKLHGHPHEEEETRNG